MWVASFALLVSYTSSIDDLHWVDAKPYLYGTGFAPSDKSNYYDRLPAAAQNTTRSVVWSLSRDSAGLFVQFVSNASSLAVNVTYIYGAMTMWHFPSTGVAGLDLYAYDEGNATWRWLATTNPSTATAGAPLVTTLTTAHRGTSLVQYRLHLPLYNGLSSASVGFGGAAAVLQTDPAMAKRKKPIVWYGTSIAQGGVASRPGMAFTNVLSRRLDREVLNFGFSGSCLMESGVAQWLALIDAAAFVVDCSWNMQPDLIANRTIPLVQQLRAAAPSTPIVLAEDTEDGCAWTTPSKRELQAAKRANLRAAYDTLAHATVSPDQNLHYVHGSALYTFTQRVGGLERALISPTVGGVHPTDLGMIAIADYYTGFLPTILGADGIAPSAPAELPRAARGPPALRQPLRAAAASTEEARQHTAALVSLEQDGRRDGHREPSDGRRAGRLVNGQSRSSRTAPAEVWMPVGEGDGTLSVMGRAFNDTLAGEFLDRLPAAAQGVVRDDVFELARDATGMIVPFVATDATAVMINYTLDTVAAPLWHMPASGTAGADLFRFDDAVGSYRFVGCLHEFPPAANSPFSATLASGLDPSGSSRFLVFLPLRKHVVDASIGVSASSLQRDEAYDADGITANGRRPIVWYGTSIDQGGVASRPGATYTNVLTRSLQRMILNFGFAGNGRSEISVAQFLVRLPASLFVIDCLPNLNATGVSERTRPLVEYIRAHGHPSTPIVLAAGTTYGDHWVNPASNDRKRSALEAEYAKLVAAGDQNLYLVANRDDELFAYEPLINPTVGGTHPTDLGHREIAAFYEPYLTKLLQDDVGDQVKRLAPPLPGPKLPPQWHGNLTVERIGQEEYHGWIYSSFDDCATRTVERGSPAGDHTAIYYLSFGNESGQCLIRDAAANECTRGFLPVAACPWGPDSLQTATYDGTAVFGKADPRSCDGWLVGDGSIYYLDSQGLPCGYVGADGGKITYLHVVAEAAPQGTFDCPC